MKGKVLFYSLFLVAGLVFFRLPAAADEIWVSPANLSATTTDGNWAVTTEGDTHFSFGIPDNFVRLNKVSVVLIASGPGTIACNVAMSISQTGNPQSFYSTSQTNLPGGAVGADQLMEVDISSIFDTAPPPNVGTDCLSFYITTNPSNLRQGGGA